MAYRYKRKSGVWYACYGPRENQSWISLKTKREDVAEKRLQTLKIDLERGTLPQRSRIKLYEFIQSYELHLRAKKKGGSLKGDLSRLGCFLEWQEEEHPKIKLLEELTTPVLSAFLSKKRLEDQLAPKSVNHYRQLLFNLFEFAIREHWFISRDPRFPNPVKATQRIPEPASEIRYLEQEDIAVQLEVLQEHPRIQAMVALLIFAGLRREALLWLTPSDVNLAKGMIYVRKKRIGGETWQPKTKKNRAVPISKALQKWLTSYQPPKGATWYFPSPKGKRWNPDNFSSDLREKNRAKALNWTCLHYRHTFGSHLAQKGISLYKIATLMGNSPEICRKHYAHLEPERMRDCVEFYEDLSSAQSKSGARANIVHFNELRWLSDG